MTNPNELTNLLHFLLKEYNHIVNEKKSENLSFEEVIENIITYYEDIINSMPGNVYWIDKNLITVGCNKNVQNMFGFKSLSEFKGLSFEDMGKVGNWSAHATQSFKKDTMEVIQTGKLKLNIEEPPIPHSDGRVIYFLTSRVPLFDRKKNVIGVVGISIDITDRKKAEEELKIAKEKAEQANRAKTEFLSNAVTEMTKSFTGIKKTLKITYKKIPPKEMHEFEAKMVSVSQILHDMENFAKFDLIHSNQFSEDENGDSSKSSKNTAENLKIFHEFYRQFNLARRESECVYYMVRGMTAKQIGRVTSLSYRTVEFYLNNAKLKLGCRTKQALISKVFESGVI
jgi:PAS domain S-box-containing protein